MAWSAKGTGRSAEQHYPVMGLEEICALPVGALAARDCWLFLWTTGPNLPQAFEVMRAWGFSYSSMGFVWVKLKRGFNPQQLRITPLLETDLHVGLGMTTRKNPEYCLLGRKGQPPRLAKDVREVILAPVRAHSVKPDETYSRIERLVGGPYCELFARRLRRGWTSWGLDLE